MTTPADCIVPEWPAPPHVRALITTRNGGVSRGPFASFNLGLRAGDDLKAVIANRAYLRRLLPQEPKWLGQQHGTAVAEVDGIEGPPPADASIARRPGTVCVIMVADCVPVLLTDKRGMLVAAAHAGWRGLARGIIENTVQGMGVPPEELLAYLGPGIGPKAFEVGADVYDTFVGQDTLAASAFAPGRAGKWYGDIYMLARLALERAGVSRVYGGGLCTVSDPLRFYSYRRDQITGRMAALIWRES
jgi:hypothetical protein